MEKVFHANGNQKKAGVAILISDKIDFKVKTITRDKEGHYIMIKVSNQGEHKTIVNIYAPNTGTLQYKRQMLTAVKGEIDSNTIIVGDFNTPLSPMDRSSKMKINKEDFPGGAVVESTCQRREHWFEPWSRKIPHAVEQLSLCTTTSESALQSLQATTTEPVCHNY